MRRIRLPVLLLMALLAGCGPQVIPAGPAVGAMAMARDALIIADGARLPLHGFNDAAENFVADTAPLFTA
jgi:hypothetical protein